MNPLAEQVCELAFFAFAEAGHRPIDDLHSQTCRTPRFLEEPVAHLVVEEMDFFRDADADANVRATYGESARGQVRRVARLLGNAQNFLARRFANAGPPVQRAIDCADGNLC